MRKPLLTFAVALLVGITAICGWRILLRSRNATSSLLASQAAPSSPAVFKSAPARQVPAPVARDNQGSRAATAPGRDALSPRLQRLLSGDSARGKISRAVINAFLDERGRTALSLLVAWQESGNEELLREAAERHPNDLNVQLAMLSTELPDEERMQWIARFKASAPENALSNYYAAAEFLRTKDVASAIAELRAGTAKPHYEDYMMQQLAEREVLFRAAGLPETEARVQAMFGTTMPYLAVLNKVRQELPTEMAARFAAGDVQGAIELGSMGMTIASQMKTASSSHVILNDLVSIAIERSMIESLGADAADQMLGASAADRLADLAKRRDEIRDLTRTIDPSANDISPAQLTQYLQIMLDSGELHALQWLKGQRE